MVLTLNKGKIRSVPESASDIILELAKRNYSGLIADTECGYDKSVEALLKQLEKAEVSPLYIERIYAKAVPDARVMISSAVKGGSFDEMICAAKKEYGSRCVLQLDRLSEDSPLPFRDTAGTKLKPADRAELQRKTGSQGFFSPKLMTNYFTYYDGDKKAHFVLYDTSSGIKRKLELAASRGFDETIIVPGQFEDIWNEIW